jgi:hypothetical protein
VSFANRIPGQLDWPKPWLRDLFLDFSPSEAYRMRREVPHVRSSGNCHRRERSVF